MATWGPEAGESRDRQIEISNPKLNSFRAAHVYTIIAETWNQVLESRTTTYRHEKGRTILGPASD